MKKTVSKRVPAWLWKLIKSNERSIVGVLEANGLVRPIDEKGERTFSNISLTDKGNAISQSVPLVTKQFITEYNQTFPVQRRANPALIEKKLQDFLTENEGIELTDILKAAKYHVDTNEATFVMNSANFIYKNTIENSTLMGIIINNPQEASQFHSKYD